MLVLDFAYCKMLVSDIYIESHSDKKIETNYYSGCWIIDVILDSNR